MALDFTYGWTQSVSQALIGRDNHAISQVSDSTAFTSAHLIVLVCGFSDTARVHLVASLSYRVWLDKGAVPESVRKYANLHQKFPGVFSDSKEAAST